MAICYRDLLRLVAACLLLTAAASAQIASLPATLQLRTSQGFSVPFQNGMPVPGFEKQRRAVIDLGGGWRKERFTATPAISMGLRDSAGYAALLAESGGRYAPGYNDSGWPTKNLPSIENELYGLDKRPEDYENGVWYRRRFTVSDSLQGRFVRLNFIAVNYVADVWLNGKYLGYHEGGYTPFSFDVSEILDSTNVLAVRVDNPA
jgi:beta-galactosidase